MVWKSTVFFRSRKKLIIGDYLSGKETKLAVYNRYTGYDTENGKITMWMRKFGIEDKFVKIPNFDSMSNRKRKKSPVLRNLKSSS